MPKLYFSSNLPVSVDEVLMTLTMEGVNTELNPFVRMTAPSAYSRRNILDWPKKQALFKSWILLFKFLPIDRHAFYFDAINPQAGFSESSSSWTNRYWNHERKVIAEGTGCRVIDTVHYQSRIPFIDLLLQPIYRFVFWQRHKYLRRHYGGSAR